MTSPAILRRVVLIKTDVSEEGNPSIIRVTRIDELGTTLPVTMNRLTLLVPTKHRFLQEPHGVTSEKTAFFIVIVVRTSNLTFYTGVQ
jgi:hypothetical protein